MTYPPASAIARYVKYGVACALFLVLFTSVEYSKLRETIATLSAEGVFVLLLVSAILVLVSVIKWRCFLRGFGTDETVAHLSKLYLVGYFVNSLLPSHLGGDVVRSASLGKRVGQKVAFAATFLERYTGLVAMVALGAICAVWSDHAPPLLRLMIAAAAVGLVIGTWAVVSSVVINVVGRIPLLRERASFLYKVHDEILRARYMPGMIVRGLSLSFLFHGLTVLNTAVAGWAVGWTNIPIGDLFVVVPLILIVGGLPITPSGLGVQEGAFYVLLQRIGATPEQALMIGIVLRAKTYLLAVIGGLIILCSRSERLVFLKKRVDVP